MCKKCDQNSQVTKYMYIIVREKGLSYLFKLLLSIFNKLISNNNNRNNNTITNIIITIIL